jgi:hypothetical protein
MKPHPHRDKLCVKHSSAEIFNLVHLYRSIIYCCLIGLEFIMSHIYILYHYLLNGIDYNGGNHRR